MNFIFSAVLSLISSKHWLGQENSAIQLLTIFNSAIVFCFLIWIDFMYSFPLRVNNNVILVIVIFVLLGTLIFSRLYLLNGTKRLQRESIIKKYPPLLLKVIGFLYFILCWVLFCGSLIIVTILRNH